MSCSSKFAGTRAMTLSLPPNATERSAKASPDLVAVNQTSSPWGDQASPCSLESSAESLCLCPARSTTEIHPRSSHRELCSMKAMRSPFGEMRVLLTHPEVSKSDLPIGNSRLQDGSAAPAFHQRETASPS